MYTREGYDCMVRLTGAEVVRQTVLVHVHGACKLLAGCSVRKETLGLAVAGYGVSWVRKPCRLVGGIG